MNSWFDVDKAGLAKIVARRGKHFILAELLQNAWDAPGVSRVDVRIEPVPNRALTKIEVEDDSPEGFANLDHAFTLFAESIKKGDPTLRGRFNFGEKLVLALSESAVLHTTTGTVTFDAGKRTINRRKRRESGTLFRAFMRMTREELTEVLDSVSSYIAPEKITTCINGEALAARSPLAQADASLTTEQADANGILRRVKRKTGIAVYAPFEGQPSRLYEMGIPIMELPDDGYDIDVLQKVPLSLDRDSVTPAYLQTVRVAVLNAMADTLTERQASATWVADALGSTECSDKAVAAVLENRFGKKAVAYDPSDIESNSRSAAAGYNVIAGGTFSASQWAQIRRAGALPAAGKVTPTPKPFGNGPMATPVKPTPGMKAFARWLETFSEAMIGKRVKTQYLLKFNAAAAYGGGVMSFNIQRLGKAWFNGPLKQSQLELVIHELAHDASANHLSEAYYEALTELGAKAAMAALENPDLLVID